MVAFCMKNDLFSLASFRSAFLKPHLQQDMRSSFRASCRNASANWPESAMLRALERLGIFLVTLSTENSSGGIVVRYS
jgi:hypothetical protein